jgi:hypothetical protein
MAKKIREVLRIESVEDNRPYHLSVTREETDDPDLEEICVNICMTQEERRGLIQHLERIDELKDTCFSITFGVRHNDPDSGLKIFEERLKRI